VARRSDARVDLRNDLSLLDEGEYEKAAYFCRKILIGAQRCYQPVEVELYFDIAAWTGRAPGQRGGIYIPTLILLARQLVQFHQHPGSAFGMDEGVTLAIRAGLG
jgi:hypothetical protein